jgi:hypothetical protein
MSDDGYRISVVIESATHEGMINSFKAMVGRLEHENYRVGYASCRGGNQYSEWTREDISITGPTQDPLTNSEILSLRTLLKDHKFY